MKFLTLEVENFMALANAKVELDQRGLVLIRGVNAGDFIGRQQWRWQINPHE